MNEWKKGKLNKQVKYKLVSTQQKIMRLIDCDKMEKLGWDIFIRTDTKARMWGCEDVDMNRWGGEVEGRKMKEGWWDGENGDDRFEFYFWIRKRRQTYRYTDNKHKDWEQWTLGDKDEKKFIIIIIWVGGCVWVFACVRLCHFVRFPLAVPRQPTWTRSRRAQKKGLNLENLGWDKHKREGGWFGWIFFPHSQMEGWRKKKNKNDDYVSLQPTGEQHYFVCARGHVCVCACAYQSTTKE